MCSNDLLQLFLEEEREKELENIFETSVIDSIDRDTEQRDNQPTGVEATEVAKQTADTLMAGERIIEAIEIADEDRAMFREYEEAQKGLSKTEAARLQPPQRNAILAAYDMEPDQYVLSIVEKIPSTALLDALLVLPFAKATSLIFYLTEWARKVNKYLASSLPH